RRPTPGAPDPRVEPAVLRSVPTAERYAHLFGDTPRSPSRNPAGLRLEELRWARPASSWKSFYRFIGLRLRSERYPKSRQIASCNANTGLKCARRILALASRISFGLTRSMRIFCVLLAFWTATASNRLRELRERGAALESEKRWEEAAELYRSALPGTES